MGHELRELHLKSLTPWLVLRKVLNVNSSYPQMGQRTWNFLLAKLAVIKPTIGIDKPLFKLLHLIVNTY